jgi:hypothetical protein
MRVELRPSTAADFLALIGRLPAYRAHCLTAVIPAAPRTALDGAAEIADGQVIGIGGFVHLPGGDIGASVLMIDRARAYRAAIHRAGLAAMRLARRAGYRRVYAAAEDGLAGAEAWLLRLGFVRVAPGQNLFVWECAADDR